MVFLIRFVGVEIWGKERVRWIVEEMYECFYCGWGMFWKLVGL